MPRRLAAVAALPYARRRPGLGLLACAAFGVAAIFAFTGCTAEAIAEGQTYAGINAMRAERGLPALTPDPQLVQVARQRSRDMAAKSYFSHSPPDGCNYVCIMDQQSVGHAWAGENIAWNTWDWKQTANIALDMWRNSPPHLENILGCHYTRVGTGAVRGGDGKVYFTMIFEGNNPC